MKPVDRDDDPATEMSSSARWDMPADGRVLWAGLYFSASADPGSGSEVSLKGPGSGEYTTISAAEVESVRLPSGVAYQAFADVTELVAAHGGGEWWVADIPAERGKGKYAGWSMVVVVEDSQEAFQTAMVLDGAEAVFRDEEGMPFPLAGLLADEVPARFDVVAWEGDADLAGDRVVLDDAALAPVEGEGSADNAFVSHARGAEGPPMTFGTDVVGFDGRLSEDSELRIVSEDDALLAGVVAVTGELAP